MRLAPKPLQEKAFTLVELLVSIAVIGILVLGITFSLTRVSEQAIQSKASSNLRQITAGMLILAHDNNNLIQVHGGPTGDITAEDFWGRKLERDLNFQRHIFFCELVDHGLPTTIDESPGLWVWRTSFGFNLVNTAWVRTQEIAESGVQESGVANLNLNQVDNHSSFLFMGSSMDERGYGRFSILRPSPSGGQGGRIHLRYGGRALVSFLDGSVKILGPDEMIEHGFTGGYGKTVDDRIFF